MIRRLIILLLIVGGVFADTIVVKTERRERRDRDGAVKTYNCLYTKEQSRASCY